MRRDGVARVRTSWPAKGCSWRGSLVAWATPALMSQDGAEDEDGDLRHPLVVKHLGNTLPVA